MSETIEKQRIRDVVAYLIEDQEELLAEGKTNKLIYATATVCYKTVLKELGL